jgi:hypothetical protein
VEAARRSGAHATAAVVPAWIRDALRRDLPSAPFLRSRSAARPTPRAFALDVWYVARSSFDYPECPDPS